MDWRWVVVGALSVGILTWLSRVFRSSGRLQDAAPAPFKVGDITAQTLRQYSGYDYTKPILLAVQDRVLDVTDAASSYAPGKPLHVYAGQEVGRALALGSTAPADVGSADVSDLSPSQQQLLATQLAELVSKHSEVGRVVPPRELTMEQLAQHDGVAVPGAPLYLAIQGTVFDVSKGKQFYGPEGVYPFAGKECARALALMSTELSDCTDRVEDLSYAEKETLREWTAKFMYKYPVIGSLVKGT